MYSDYCLNNKKLRQAVASRGLANVGELLRKASLHRNSLNDYIEGRRSVFSSVTRKICQALDCDPLSLLIRNDTPPGADVNEQALRELLRAMASTRESIVFFLLGSRARGEQRELSDWDIAVSAGRTALAVDEYLSIKAELEDGVENFSVGVDLINFDHAPRWFVQGIDYEPQFLVGNENTFAHAVGVIDGVSKT